MSLLKFFGFPMYLVIAIVSFQPPFAISVQPKVRDWVSILPAGVSLKNAFKARKWIDSVDQTPLPQSFSYMARSGQVNFPTTCIELAYISMKAANDSNWF